MNRITLAAAGAVIVLAVVGYNLLPASNLGPGTTAAPTSTLGPSPTGVIVRETGAQILHQGRLAPGTYAMFPFSSPGPALRVTVTVPSGWNGSAPGTLYADAGTEGPDGAAVTFILPTQLFVDPCEGSAIGSPTISAGKTVQDLVDALKTNSMARGPSYHLGAAADASVDGFQGKRIDLIVPSDVDFTQCDDGQYWIFDVGPYAQGPGNRWTLTILDVDGTRVVVLEEDFAGTPLLVRQQMQGIVDSITIEPQPR